MAKREKSGALDVEETVVILVVGGQSACAALLHRPAVAFDPGGEATSTRGAGTAGRVAKKLHAETGDREAHLYDAAIARPDLDSWLPTPNLRVSHRRESSADPQELWEAAQNIRLSETRMLGRLVRWRIPGVPADASFEELFRNPPFAVLDSDESSLVSGLVGRIWTLRRDYPRLSDPEEFREWSRGGTARVLFAHWTEPAGDGRTALSSEARVQALGAQGRIGLAAVRPLVRGFNYLIGTDGIEIAVRRAERNAR